MSSSRFPGKPLLNIEGKTMIQHVWLRSKMCNKIDEVYIATCDNEIKNEAERFGAKVIMTRDDHEMCMERVCEASEKIESDIVVTIQGDEPLIHPDMIEKSINLLIQNRGFSATTLAQKIYNKKEIANTNRVKIIWKKNKEVIYISREPIPSKSKYKNEIDYYKMVCVYAMRKKFLQEYNLLPKNKLEEIESIDMLRIIENNHKLGVEVIDGVVENIDVESDISLVLNLMKNDDLYKRYKN